MPSATADGNNLLKEFKISQTGGDDSMGLVSFIGDQAGKPVEVTFATERTPSRLAYVYVGGETAFSCR